MPTLCPSPSRELTPSGTAQNRLAQSGMEQSEATPARPCRAFWRRTPATIRPWKPRPIGTASRSPWSPRELSPSPRHRPG
ncbi:hypothetical protein ACFFX0_07070 [Citricoccus parietis]|uniref:Uncharacterized protein n=1 Tax=Citricoccus parietis TaxID=592307 RepID=A0ABV5FWA3_9MICC